MEVREFLEGKEDFDSKKEADRNRLLDEMKRYMDTETLLDELVLNGPNSQELKELFEYWLRMNDTGGRMTELREELKNISGRRDLIDFYKTNLESVVDKERFLNDMVSAMSADQFNEIASEVARLYDMPGEIRDQLR